ncbi:pentapeptide repeat-containing protein [Leifsonia sp. YAF41]
MSQRLYAGKSWLENPETKAEMFSAFAAARQLHEMLWYLAEAQARTFDPDASDRVTRLSDTIGQAVGGELTDLLELNVQDLHSQVRSTLIDVSLEVRASYLAAGDDHLDAALKPGADLMGQNLRSRRLCGADLRGAYLIASDLRGSDLSGADLLGADLRDARLDGADLSQSLFLTQPHVNAARGTLLTLLPADLERPSHWQNG